MPGDLLGHLIEPTAPSYTWLWVAAALVCLIVLWYAGLYWWTTAERDRGEPSLIASARMALQRRRALRVLQGIQNRYRAGDITSAGAGAELSEELRRFLHDVTGVRAQYVQVPDIVSVSGGVLAPAGPVLADLADAQFNAHSRVDIDVTAQSAEDLVRRWT